MVDRDDSPKFLNTKANRKYRSHFGDFRLVGDGKVSGSYCGVYHGIDGCVRVDLHKGKKWKGKDCTDKAYVRIIHMSCKKPSCPLCFRHGWGGRSARCIATRLEAVAVKCGLDIEHIVLSPSESDYELCLKDYSAFRRKAMRIMKMCGVIGGQMLFHAYRFDDIGRVWYGSPHFHVLGFIEGNYGCRGCTKDTKECLTCSGFEGVVRRQYDKYGWIVKVLSERKSIVATAKYELGHATYSLGVNRFHIFTYFGICGNRVFKSPAVVKKKSECPICKYDIEKLVYLGGLLYLEKWRRERGSPSKSNEFLLSFKEDGRVVWDIDGRH